MPYSCDNCGSPLDDASIDRVRELARCQQCSCLNDLAGKLATQGDAPAARERKPVPLPAKFQVAQEPGALAVRWRWFGPKFLFMLLFCAVWDGFLVFWYGTAMSAEGPGSAMMVLFPIGHVAVGLFLSYTTLCGLLNRTEVTASRSGFTIRHAPLPWRGNRTIEAQEVEQLFCEEKVSQGKNGTTTSYTLCAVLKPDRRKLVLLSGLEEPQAALWLEQALERQLRIVDRPIAGELAL